jgi:hypothetical protein
VERPDENCGHLDAQLFTPAVSTAIAHHQPVRIQQCGQSPIGEQGRLGQQRAIGVTVDQVAQFAAQ